MRVNDASLERHLAGELRPIYLVFGGEPLLVQDAADRIRAAARAREYGERQRLVVEQGFDWDTLGQMSASLSLFASRRLIELHMAAGKPGDAGGKALRRYAELQWDDTVLLVICAKLDSASQRSRWFKALEQAGVCVQVRPVGRRQLPAWIESRMRKQGLQPAPAAVALLADRVEGNLLAAAQEIDKLVAAMGKGHVDADQVMAVVSDSARFDPFDLVDAALDGAGGRVTRIVDGLREEGVELVLVSWALAREIRALATMAGDIDRGMAVAQTLQGHRVWDQRKASVTAALKRHGSTALGKLLQGCAGLDRTIKGIDPGSPWDELLELTLRVAGCDLNTAAGRSK